MPPIEGAIVVATVGLWLHVGACVLLPLAWGVATEFAFRRLTRRRPQPPEPPAEQHFFLDYHI